MTLIRRIRLILLVLSTWTTVLSAQTTFATITGAVTDSSGLAMPDVAVTATHVATRIETTGRSNADGVYTIAQLREGAYTVRASKTGFKEFLAQDVNLVGRDYRRIDIRLEVGSVDTRIEVIAGSTLIETETARISDTRDVAQLRDMPLNSRAIWAQLSLVPNVLQAAGSSTIRFSGSRSNQSHWSIDGTTMSDGISETQIGPLANYVESFQEVRIDASNNTAEFGTIGQVTMITKAGTNEFHGSLFDYYSTPWFRARNPFASARATGISHLPGGSAGGPVRIPGVYDGRNKTFVFGSFETFKGSQTTRIFNPTVPLESWRSGDFSSLGTPVLDPTNNQPFAGARIPAARLNATSVAMQNRFYPLPNFGSSAALVAQNHRQNLSLPAMKQNYYMIRGDHRFSEKDSVMGRYTLQDFKTDDFMSALPTFPAGYATRKNHAATVTYTHTFSPSMLNEFRWGMATNNLPITPPIMGKALVQELGLQGLAPDLPDIPGVLQINFAGLGLTPIAQNNWRNPGATNHLQNFQDHISIFRGRHNVKFGANLARIEGDNLGADANLFGNLTFSNRYTGQPYADFLLGLPSTARRSFPPLRLDRKRYQYDFFITDDFKLNSRLTMNIGLRYEYHPGWQEDNGRLATFDIGSGRIVVQDGSAGKVNALFPQNYVQVVEASSVGLAGKTIVRTDRNNFAPRIGLAWRPWGNNTVLRTGFGIYYDVVPRELTMSNVPFLVNEEPFNNPTPAVVVLPRVFPAAGAAGPSSVSLPAAVNPNLQMPYSMQYSFTIEHSRWDTGFRASYIGTNTRQGDYSYNYNSPLPDANFFVDKARPFPQYPGINYFTNGAGHQFHSFTAEVERRMARGLQFQSSWVWARDIGDLERGQALENPFDRARERSVWQDIPTHRFTTNLIYQLPWGKGRPFLSNANRAFNAIVGGWEISAIYSYYSGQFLTPFWTGADPTGTAFSSTRTRPIVTIRPDHLRDANLSGDQRSLSRWFDGSAFGAPPVGRFGNSAKGVIKGPNVNIWHAGFFKSFYFTDRARLRYEVTATNFFNHPNYSNPATNISQAAAVGVISSIGGVNGASTGDQPFERSFRMGLRLEW
ncbi:MAG: carboxypeptidase regulatory-like domain-containing protein [Bryobacterales bacterium]|nr:carboxypeptidase regulatory-like domain-containing protein [Bryobacterales bacterium]